MFAILVIEDDPSTRRLMNAVLRRGGYTPIDATDGQHALEIMDKQHVDLILLDIMMPRMDGLDMVKAMKSDPNTSHILILLLSAKSSLDDRIQGLESGADDYIPKPFHASYLLARIRSLASP